MSTTSPEPEESNEPLFPESQTSLRKFLLDSALIVAVISASCFALGQFALLPDAEKAGIPNHLVPEPAVQTVATIGGIYLFVAGVFLFFAYAIVRACLLAFSPVWRDRQAASARKRYLQHPADYSILAVFVLLVCLVTFVRLGPSLGRLGLALSR